MPGAHLDLPSRDDIVTLVDENPLAWIVLEDDTGRFATAAPVRSALVDGRLEKLVGHIPRGGRIAEALGTRRKALILILGPHGYVSPSWMSDRTQAPTWNFVAAQFTAEVALVDDPTYLEGHLRDLSAAAERGRRNAWQIDEMGSRLQELAARIVAFEAGILETGTRFKLGQDENDETFPEIVRGLTSEGNLRLVDWMRRFNPARG